MIRHSEWRTLLNATYIPLVIGGRIRMINNTRAHTLHAVVTNKTHTRIQRSATWGTIEEREGKGKNGTEKKRGELDVNNEYLIANIPDISPIFFGETNAGSQYRMAPRALLRTDTTESFTHLFHHNHSYLCKNKRQL